MAVNLIGFRWELHCLLALPWPWLGFGGSKKRAKGLQMSSNDYAIKVEYLSKRYQIYNRPEDRLKQSIIPRVQALVGRPPKLIFMNSGRFGMFPLRSTKGKQLGLLDVMALANPHYCSSFVVHSPQPSGKVMTNGRIAALLELGSGFNPEFTGRENVYLNGAILGLAKMISMPASMILLPLPILANSSNNL